MLRRVRSLMISRPVGMATVLEYGLFVALVNFTIKWQLQKTRLD